MSEEISSDTSGVRVLARHVKRDESVLHRGLDEEAVLLDLSKNLYYGLNPVGARIWELLDGRSLQDVRDVILEEFDVDAETAERDILHLVSELEERGLIRSGD